jgi:hypothetical protein
MAGTTPGNDTPSHRRALAAAVVAVVLASTGCTICPDPFDYSGPVPDGSPPQNDFRARAGGILPVGAAPKPWPPIVKDVGRPDEMPVIADDESVDQSPVVAEEDQTELRQTSVLVPQRDVDAADDAGTVEPAAGVDLAPVPAATPAAAPPALPLQVDTPLPAGLSVEAGVASPAMAPTPSPEPRESPGWRPRRHSAL